MSYTRMYACYAGVLEGDVDIHRVVLGQFRSIFLFHRSAMQAIGDIG